MGAFVFVMMVYTHGHWIPSLEFTVEGQCEKAVEIMKAEVDKRLLIGNSTKSFCLKIPKG